MGPGRAGHAGVPVEDVDGPPHPALLRVADPVALEAALAREHAMADPRRDGHGNLGGVGHAVAGLVQREEDAGLDHLEGRVAGGDERREHGLGAEVEGRVHGAVGAGDAGDEMHGQQQDGEPGGGLVRQARGQTGQGHDGRKPAVDAAAVLGHDGDGVDVVGGEHGQRLGHGVAIAGGDGDGVKGRQEGRGGLPVVEAGAAAARRRRGGVGVGVAT